MLDFEITKQPDAVEKLFCEEFDKLERHQMDKDLTEILFSLFLAGNNFKIPKKEKPFLFQLIEKRINVIFKYEVNDDRLILFLCALTESPGQAVMYLTYLQYWCKKNNTKSIDLELFSEKIFPFGFPKKQKLSELWDKIKVNINSQQRNTFHSDNLLDYATAMVSINNEEEKQ